MTEDEYDERIQKSKDKFFDGEISLFQHFLELDEIDKEKCQSVSPQ